MLWFALFCIHYMKLSSCWFVAFGCGLCLINFTKTLQAKFPSNGPCDCPGQWRNPETYGYGNNMNPHCWHIPNRKEKMQCLKNCFKVILETYSWSLITRELEECILRNPNWSQLLFDSHLSKWGIINWCKLIPSTLVRCTSLVYFAENIISD